MSTNEYEFQMLFGMAGPVKSALAKFGQPMRDYTPTGGLLPGMAYLVRRLLENTSNEGFLRKTFVDQLEWKALLDVPLSYPGEKPPSVADGLIPFTNEPTLDFSQRANHNACRQAINKVREKFIINCPALIGGEKITSGQKSISRNPSRPKKKIGNFVEANHDMLDKARL